MSDNVELNPASGGATILTDDCTTGQAQIIKLAISTDGSPTLIPADAANGIDVDVTRVGGTVAVTQSGTWDEVGINDSGNSITVDNGGTFAVQAAQSGTWNVTNVSGTVSLPTGASTSAKQDTIIGHIDGLETALAGTLTTDSTLQTGDNTVGRVKLTDGTDVADILDLSNSNPLTVAIVDGSGDQITSFGGGTQYTEDAAAAANPVGTALTLVRDDARGGSLTTTDGDNVAARGTNAGELYVKHVDSIPVTQSGTWDEVGINDSGNSITVDWAGTAPPIGAGTEAAALRVTLATDSTGLVSIDDNGGAITVDNGGTFAVQVDGAALTALQKIDDPVLVDDAGFTPGSSSVMMAGFEADESSIDSVNEGDAGAARMTLDRKIIVNPQPHSAGGLSIFRSLDLDESEEEVSATACCVYSVWVTNTATSTRFVKFYNLTAANTTVGSSTPAITIGIPGNSSDDIAGVFTAGGHGITFDTALSVAATTAVADADTGAPSANDVIINIFYKA